MEVRARPSELGGFFRHIIPVHPAIAGLEAFREEGWDGQAAAPVTDEQIMRLSALFEGTVQHLPLPNVVPGFDGSVGILWDAYNVYLYLDVATHGAVHFYAQMDEGEPVERVFAGRPIEQGNSEFQAQLDHFGQELIRRTGAKVVASISAKWRFLSNTASSNIVPLTDLPAPTTGYGKWPKTLNQSTFQRNLVTFG